MVACIEFDHKALIRFLPSFPVEGKEQLMDLERLADQEQNVEEADNDKISLLPDDILHRILLFLPTKEVVPTSLLSKRWKDLWTSIPSLDFDDSSFFLDQTNDIIWYTDDPLLLMADLTDIPDPLDVTRFISFIDKVFLTRDEDSGLNRFRLSSRICFGAIRVSELIPAVIRHNVQELDLSLSVEQPFMFPACAFYNRIIRIFKLRMNVVLHLPPDISLPSLKILHLCNVTFESDSSMQSLFSCCPSRTELAILDCDWRNLRSITITMPSLKRLTIRDISFDYNNREGCKIRIDAGNITLFIYSGNLLNAMNVKDISSSAVASIDIPIRVRIQRKTVYRTGKLFGELKYVRCLRISQHTIKYLFVAEDVLPTFGNLKTLSLIGKFTKSCIEWLLKFLHYLPQLETLCADEGISPYASQCKPIGGPNCGLSSLETVIYRDLHGMDTEICFLQFLLQNAIVLEKMDIFWSTSFAQEPTKREMITNLLQGVCRDSSLCVLTLT